MNSITRSQFRQVQRWLTLVQQSWLDVTFKPRLELKLWLAWTPPKKPSKQSWSLQFSTLTIMLSSSQQNQSAHLSHDIIPFWGENRRPGCDFSIKASGLSGLVCVLEPEIERRISAVMTCLCACKKGSVPLLSMNCVLVHIPTELSLWDNTHPQKCTLLDKTLIQHGQFTCFFSGFTLHSYAPPCRLSRGPFFNSSGNLTPQMRACVRVCFCVRPKSPAVW